MIFEIKRSNKCKHYIFFVRNGEVLFYFFEGNTYWDKKVYDEIKDNILEFNLRFQKITGRGLGTIKYENECFLAAYKKILFDESHSDIEKNQYLDNTHYITDEFKCQ